MWSELLLELEAVLISVVCAAIRDPVDVSGLCGSLETLWMSLVCALEIMWQSMLQAAAGCYGLFFDDCRLLIECERH